MYSYLQPEGGIKVLTSSDIASKYSTKGYQNGFADVLRFVESEGGNSKKMILKDKSLFASVKSAFESLSDGKKLEDASVDEMIAVFDKGHKNRTKEVKDLYSLLESSENPLIKKAKSVNSSFDFVTTILIVPLMLGFVLPKTLEYKLKQSKKANAADNKAQNPSQPSVNVQSFVHTMNKNNSQAFKSFTQMVG